MKCYVYIIALTTGLPAKSKRTNNDLQNITQKNEQHKVYKMSFLVYKGNNKITELEEVKNSDDQYISPIFTVPKKDGEHRMIIQYNIKNVII
jgi:hypothetical protein